MLEDSQEKAYIYSEIIKHLEGLSGLEGNSLIGYIGSGSIGVAVYDGEKIIYSQNIAMGASKLRDSLQGLRRKAEDFHVVLEEYMDTILNRVNVAGVPGEEPGAHWGLRSTWSPGCAAPGSPAASAGSPRKS